MARSITDALSGLAVTRPEPTAQQTAIVEAMLTGENLACIAYAGSGKTGTGVEVAHQLTGASGYFVFFNRAAVADAQKRLPTRIQSVTGHGLAFRQLIEPNPGFMKKMAGALGETPGRPLSASVISDALRLTAASAPEFSRTASLATCIFATVKAFQISADRHITRDHVPIDYLPLATRHNPDRREACQDTVVQWATELWQRMINDKDPLPMDHDTYLKIAQLRGTRFDADLWILDEYQDTTPAMADLIRQQPGQKLFIGDPNQAIYGWRGATNALEAPIQHGLPVQYLNESFRFNHQVAGLATLLLRATGQTTPVLGQARNLLHRQQLDPETVICRNNLALIARAARTFSDGCPVRLDTRIPANTKARLLSALALLQNRPQDITVPALAELGSWKALRAHVEGLPGPHNDYHYLIELVETYQDKLPVLLHALEHPNSSASTRHSAPVTFVTAHRAKGRQWPFVALTADLAIPDTLMSKLLSGTTLSTEERESVNLLYVAITRAELGLSLPGAIRQNFKRLNEAFALPDDSTETFTASHQVPVPDAHQRILTRHRTSEFISKHRR